MPKKIRNIQGNDVLDPSVIQNLGFNKASGAEKNMEVGRHLLPIPFISGGAVAYKTDASGTALALPNKGICLAVYNNAGAVGSITLGESAAQASLAAGATDATGHVGIPCPPNQWSFIACAEQNFVIASAATLLVFIIDDDTSIQQEVR